MVKRICAYCKKEEYITDKNAGDFVFYKKYYHNTCFECFCAKKMQKCDTKNDWSSICANEDKYREIAIKMYFSDAVNDFLREHYEVLSISRKLSNKLKQVYEGTYKGLFIPISPKDFLEMYKYYLSDLDEIIAYKGLDGESAVNYCIAVLVNKLTAYRKEMKRLEVEKMNALSEMSQPIIDYSRMNMRSNVQKKEDISDLFD